MKVVNVMASSLDGSIAAFPQETDAARRDYNFIIPEDQQLLLDEIKTADAIITGGNSLRVTGTVSTLPNHLGKLPIWVILSNHPQDFDPKFWKQQNVERIIVSREHVDVNHAANSQTNLHFKNYGERHPAEFIIEFLRTRGCEKVLLFGGGETNRLFYEKGLVNELKLTLCPFIFAGLNSPALVARGAPLSAKFALIASHQIRSHVFLHYRVQ